MRNTANVEIYKGKQVALTQANILMTSPVVLLNICSGIIARQLIIPEHVKR